MQKNAESEKLGIMEVSLNEMMQNSIEGLEKKNIISSDKLGNNLIKV